MNPKPDARSLATQILTEVLGHRRSLSEELDVSCLADMRDQALVQVLCYGVLRWLLRLQAILHYLLPKPLKTKDRDIEALLLVGLYQHIYLRIPPHAATAATVNVTRILRKNWAAKLVNAVLRNFQRQREELLLKSDHDISARLAHPTWLLDQLQQDWPHEWEAIAQANNRHPPFTLRVNTQCLSRGDYLRHLQQVGLVGIPTPHTECGITLEQAVEVHHLPGFHEGWVSVQDGAAQLVAPLLEVPSGARVLDACAAPGGKTAHLLERYDIGTLVAVDHQPKRVQKLFKTLQRLKLRAQIHCADVTCLKDWWDGQLFDRILLDAPCTGSGVIRRHPDIKYLRQLSDIEKLSIQQAHLLEALWPLLKPGGKLLYVTCSLFAQENYLQLQRFLAHHDDAQQEILKVEWGYVLPIGRQILPIQDNLDGFYYACLSKHTTFK